VLVVGGGLCVSMGLPSFAANSTPDAGSGSGAELSVLFARTSDPLLESEAASGSTLASKVGVPFVMHPNDLDAQPSVGVRHVPTTSESALKLGGAGHRIFGRGASNGRSKRRWPPSAEERNQRPSQSNKNPRH
jgi:hypothetical protein